MLLSIIIPTYNETENISNKLQNLSRLADNTVNIEIIISDSPESDDNMQRLCDGYSKVRYLLAQNKGRACQMNEGAALAEGEVLLFLHADVSLPVDFYQQIGQAVSSGFSYGFFSYKFDQESWLLKINGRFTKKDGFFAGGGDQCQFITKELFDQLGGYDSEFCIMEDFRMTDTIRRKNIPFKIIDSPAVVSARKYQRNSWLKVNMINLYVFLRYRMGTPPIKLIKIYRSLLREGV